MESNEASNETVLSASRRKLKLSETAEKLALEASQSIDYGGQGYHLIDINKLASSVSEAHVWYYGLAIRQNTVSSPNPTDKDVAISVYAMKKNTIAILHHSVQSKDLKKQHRFCPPGPDSWCKWQQDQALGTSMYKGDDCLPEVFLELLKPTFLTLSDSQWCVRGATQNNNESINSLVWARCPKHKNHGVKVVCAAAASAICQFRSGASSREKVMQ